MKKANKSQTSRKEALLLERAKWKITHQLTGGLLFILVGLMAFNTMGMTWAANQDTSELNLTISAGSLEMMNTEARVNFSGTAGTASNNFQNLDGTTIRDFRAAEQNWDVNAYSDPLTGETQSSYVIANTSISLWPSNTTKVNVETYDITKLGNGVNTSLGADNKIFNSEYGAEGAVRLDNILLKVNMAGTEVSQDYSGALTFTVIAS